MITITTIKRAERLLRGGVNVSQLTVDQDDLRRLGVPDQEHEAILHGDAAQQVEHLLPHVRRIDAQQARDKASSRQAQLRRCVQDLVRSAKCAPEGIELAPQALACVVSGPDFKVLNLLGPVPVRLPCSRVVGFASATAPRGATASCSFLSVNYFSPSATIRIPHRVVASEGRSPRLISRVPEGLPARPLRRGRHVGFSRTSCACPASVTEGWVAGHRRRCPASATRASTSSAASSRASRPRTSAARATLDRVSSPGFSVVPS